MQSKLETPIGMQHKRPQYDQFTNIVDDIFVVGGPTSYWVVEVVADNHPTSEALVSFHEENQGLKFEDMRPAQFNEWLRETAKSLEVDNLSSVTMVNLQMNEESAWLYSDGVNAEDKAHIAECFMCETDLTFGEFADYSEMFDHRSPL